MTLDMDAANAIESAIDAKIAKASSKRTRATGKVTRIDPDGTVYVMLDGSDVETPVKNTAAAVQPDEDVSVTISNGSMSIDGNYSRPATDDRAAKEAQQTADDAIHSANEAATAAASALSSAETAANAAAAAQTDATAASSAASTAQTQAAAAVTAAGNASTAAATAQASADAANNSLKSVVQGATTVEKAVSVMQTALEAVVDYDPQNDTVQEYFWHDANGAHVLGDTSGYRNDIDSTGMDIVEVSSEDSVAKFGAGGSQIGKDDESHLELDYHSMQLIDKEGNTYFFISDFRNVHGVADITEAYTANGEDTDFGNMLPPTEDTTHVYIDDVETTEFELMHPSVTSYYISLDNAPASGAEVRIEYKTRSSLAKGFTIGVRKDGNVGAYSTAIGNSTLASGTYSVAIGGGADASGYGSIAIGSSSATGTKSVAFGFGNVSSGVESFAIGSQTEASGTAAYAEGYRTVSSREYAHSEGSQTTANGRFSHAEGVHSTAKHDGAHAEGNASMAKGQYSHAQNSHTTAAKIAQTALGTYNIEDASSTTTHPSGSNGYGTYAVIIGNGTADTARSNALAVTWKGAIESGIRAAGAHAWINIMKGEAALFVPKDPNAMNNAVAVFTQETAGGGAWALANYQDEWLRFIYMTPADRASSANTVVPVLTLTQDGLMSDKSSTLGSTVPVGTILDFAGASIPSGWLECNGAAVSRTTYPRLFAVIGTTWGAGNGSTTFNLPDLGGRVAIGKGSRSVGATGGEETHTLTVDEMPSHTHRGMYSSGSGTKAGMAGVNTNNWYATGYNENTGGGQAHNNMQPYAVVRKIIKAS